MEIATLCMQRYSESEFSFHEKITRVRDSTPSAIPYFTGQ